MTDRPLTPAELNATFEAIDNTALAREEQALRAEENTADPYASSPDAGDDSACNCGSAWHARRQHCVDWPCPGCDRICPPEPGA